MKQAYILKPYGERVRLECNKGKLIHCNGVSKNSMFGYMNRHMKTFFVQSLGISPVNNTNRILQDAKRYLKEIPQTMQFDNNTYNIRGVMTYPSYEEALYAISTSPYKVFSILHMHDRVDQCNVLQKVRINEIHLTENEQWLLTEAMPEYDSYRLYQENGIYLDYAMVPDLATSTMLNCIFRNIPENQCLDLIEESDDDDQNGNIIITNKVRMLCRYNTQFQKWVPISDGQRYKN